MALGIPYVEFGRGWPSGRNHLLLRSGWARHRPESSNRGPRSSTNRSQSVIGPICQCATMTDITSLFTLVFRALRFFEERSRFRRGA
jgi:hypothetical protein